MQSYTCLNPQMCFAIGSFPHPHIVARITVG